MSRCPGLRHLYGPGALQRPVTVPVSFHSQCIHILYTFDMSMGSVCWLCNLDIMPNPPHSLCTGAGTTTPSPLPLHVTRVPLIPGVGGWGIPVGGTALQPAFFFF
mmetsp:Transcript_55931/g.92914  ORF Transcript_55931/g.92914 Transcript_55931/m.92914 type:complete len:105 (-) Transcript_55931:576-890(-)